MKEFIPEDLVFEDPAKEKVGEERDWCGIEERTQNVEEGRVSEGNEEETDVLQR